jgi:hypothetical protein
MQWVRCHSSVWQYPASDLWEIGLIWVNLHFDKTRLIVFKNQTKFLF